MRHKLIYISCLVLLLAACSLTTEDAATPTPAPTQTPFVITATPEPNTPTPTATQEPAPTAQPARNATRVPTLVNCTPRADWVAYTIQAGDTLGSIAQANSTTVAALTQANCLADANFIYVGQPLRVPPSAATAQPTPEATEEPVTEPTEAATEAPATEEPISEPTEEPSPDTTQAPLPEATAETLGEE
ncbi:MAG: LysM peptidoglycan-binding domain-containing protein [Anaerolineales bacterium]